MKLFILLACIFVITNAIRIKFDDTLAIKKDECNPDDPEVLRKLELFKDRFKTKRNDINESPVCLEGAGICRSVNQLFFIAFCRINSFYSEVHIRKSNIDEGFIFEVELDLSKNGVSTFRFLLDDMSKSPDSRRDIPVFKICIPTSVGHASFVDYHCPFKLCKQSFAESRKCETDRSLNSVQQDDPAVMVTDKEDPNKPTSPKGGHELRK